MYSIRQLAKTPIFQIFKKDQNNCAIVSHLAETHLALSILADFLSSLKSFHILCTERHYYGLNLNVVLFAFYSKMVWIKNSGENTKQSN